MSECDREISIMTRPWSTGGCFTIEEKTVLAIGVKEKKREKSLATCTQIEFSRLAIVSQLQ